ncbi:XkdN-like protein [Paenibacillus sp. 32O-W]|uniref:phage tail assembly chaperone n=1 Tax=Paenibacillus sp. 32O-W TaxID=1695218 RepID=UPI000721D3CE|nr:XkdN-like protein [Paenibacillus sp. 32O-W]ALS25491.1 XkdN-like protein [Paenibacillus sp. 32O-W]
MSTLQEFLNSNPIDNLTEEVVISERFKDRDGNVLKFKIRAMTSKEFDDIRKRSMRLKKGRQFELDVERFNSAIVINQTVVPDFRNAASIEKLGCATPEEYLNKVLLAGEIAELVNQIQRLSGFDRDMNELIDEAKN